MQEQLSKLKISVFFLALFAFCGSAEAQVSYGASVSYGLRKVVPSYAGSAIQIRRTCDNGTLDLGFSSCGDLDLTTLADFVTASNPLSAISSASSASFSVRLLRCTYAGRCMNVRRSSDNTTQDIGFTANGDMDTTALKTFVGANNGFVVTWYDQSGNARNATQATAGNQPRIVNAGVVDRVNGVPAVYFGGITFGLNTAAFNIYNGAVRQACFNGVAKVNANLAGAYNAILSKTGTGGSSNQPSPLDFYYNVTSGNNTLFVGNGAGNNGGTNFAGTRFNAAANALQVWTFQSSNVANTTNAYCNGTNVVTNASSTNYGDVNSGLYLGKRADGVTGLNGWISEIVTFNALPSATDRAFLEWSQSQYFNISGMPALGALPASPASAFIAKWYDQSGNGKDLVQATTGNQPRIVNAGVTSLQGGLPAFALDGTNYYLGEATLSIANPYSANIVATRTAASAGYQRLINMSATGDAYGYLGAFGGNYATFSGNGVAWNDVTANTAATAVTLNSQAILSMNVATGATGLTPYINGTAQNTKVGTAATATGFLVGAPYNAVTTNQLWTGNVSEVHILPAALSTTRRTLLETNQAAYHTIAISNSKYTVASGYNLYVNGVGRTSSTDSVANTRQSKGMGFIVGMAASDYLKDDGDYMTCGMTCPTGLVSLANLPALITERWMNDWYLNKTDVGANNGDIQIYFDFSEYGVPGVPGIAGNYVILGRNSTAANFTITPTTNVTVSGDRVIFTLPAANLGAVGYYTIGTYDYTDSNLPVELLEFGAKQNGSKVDLNWTTATETNNHHFTIERSADALIFTELKRVNSKAPNGNSLLKLEYKDQDANPLGGTSYYRLKQTDHNGKSETFNVVSVSFVNNKNITFSVIPNPNSGEFKVDFTGIEHNHEIGITLFDLQGRKVYSGSFYTEQNSTSFDVIPTQKISKGIYTCLLSFEGVEYPIKVVIN